MLLAHDAIFYFYGMATVYILFSEHLDRFYIGSCKNLPSRITDHLNKTHVNSFTTKASDWLLFLTIGELSYKQARFIEMHLKKMKSTTYIHNLKKYPEMIGRLKSRFR